MTVTIIGTVTARPECRAELEAILTQQVAPTRAEAGCINYDFHVDAGDDCVFVFYENWRSQDDLDQHMKTPHLQPLLSEIDRLLARPVEIRHLRMIGSPAN
ncbi:antibiotic biosynthesis monooxygenase [Rhizobium sp. Leaf384]|uniref:putative quinol monooxygenase n=1 Tax=unclassified Rhizobium TaxID=2613769 RepID=UPI0007161556|nr:MULTISPECIES: putative quinol monooxygenase [unclassified Rhizobium]KQS80838.1 antibiotic biosynthesis monooxygenase [Rhizobium sp. Leaf384]KQS86698.1 antibiotic biosynthesis monooxygenase [Rhizobium sp. Leaf383]